MPDKFSDIFVINDIPLDIPPADIQAIQKRNISPRQFVRDEASYSFMTPFSTMEFTTVMAFDVTNNIELEKLTRLAVELDQYPFVFIHNDKLASYVYHTHKPINGTHIYGVSSYTFSQSAEFQNVIILELVLLFFNYLPFASKLEFYDIKKETKFSRTPEPFDSSLMGCTDPITGDPCGTSETIYNKPSSTPSTSGLFKRFFKAGVAERWDKVRLYGTKDKPRSTFSLSAPTFTIVEPEGIEGIDYERIVSTSFRENFDSEGNEIEKKSNSEEKFVTWKDARNDANQFGKAVRSAAITKRNNFVTHNMTGWTYPILQYMGKGGTSMTLSVDGDYGRLGNNAVNPLKYLFAKMDINFVKHRGLTAYNVLKIDSLLVDLASAYGFILDQENAFANSTENGKDLFTYVLQESDTRALMQRKKLNSAGTKKPDIQIEIMIDVINNITDNIIRSPKNRELHISRSFIPIVPAFASYSDQEYDEAEELLEDLREKLEGVLTQVPEEVSKRRRGALGGGRKHYTDGIRGIREMLQERLDLNPSSADLNKIYQIDRSLETVFYRMLKFADRGNKYVTPYMHGFMELISENYDSIVEDFEGEAIDDMKLGDRLGDLSDIGYKDARDIPPFFFLRQQVYMTSKNISNAFDIQNKIESEVFADNINKLVTSDSGEHLTMNFGSPELTDGIKEETTIKSGILNDGIPDGEKNTLDGKLREREEMFKATSIEDIDPFNEHHQAAFQGANIASHFEKGINLAFPTIKVWMVEGNEADMSNTFTIKKHGYYELKGIVSVHVVTNNDDNPVDVLRMSIANPGSVRTDDHVLYDAYYPERKPELVDTEGEVRVTLDQIRLRPGNRLHIRAGYSNNPNDLTTIFNGVITEMGGEKMLDVVAEGYGRELVAYEHGDDPTEDNFFMSATTGDIMSMMLYSKEIEHFGQFKLNFNADSGELDSSARRLFTTNSWGIFGFSTVTRLFTNLYIEEITNTGEIKDGEGDFSGGFWQSTNFFDGKQWNYHFPIYRSTPWSVLKEMEYRHPGTLSKPVTYGDRMSYFFGIKEQLYVYRDLANELMVSSSSSQELVGKYNTVYQKIRALRYKPVCNFHLITSENNIISNSLKVTDNFNTVVNVQHYSDEDKIEDSNFEYYEMKADDNLKPMAHRRGELAMNGTHGKFLAYRYGSVYLKKELEKMYDGKIVVVGNPSIKAGDYILLNDSFRSLDGIIKVREAIHHFDLNLGFVTEITPGLYVESSHMDYSKLFPKLALALQQLVSLIRARSESANESNPEIISTALLLDLVNQRVGQEDFDTNRLAIVVEGLLGSAIALASRATLANQLKAATSPTFVGPPAPGKLTNATHFVKKGGASMTKQLSKLVARSATVLKNAFPLLSELGSVVGPIAGRGLAIGRVLTGPVGFAAGLALSIISAKLEEEELTRQPVRIYPLQQSGSVLTGGIHGYRENGYWDSLGDKVSETFDEAKYLFDYLTASLSSGV
jgi:hypothetical protein